METSSKTAAASPDLSFNGKGVYTLVANTPQGVDFVRDNVSFEDWQGTPETGIAIDGSNLASDIAEKAHSDGLAVEVNGETFRIE